MNKFLYLLLFFSAAVFTACSETDGEDNEYDNWQERNDTYFSSVYAQAQSAIAKGDNSWKVIRCYSKSESTTNQNDFIVAKVISESNYGDMAIYSDSVSIHYRGRLMPSASYSEGYLFDSTWTGDYDLQTMKPYSALASSFVNGFTTAIMNMHAGDRWEVYIPYNLGYGETDKSSIPAYSTLKFDLTLTKIWK